MNIKNLINKFKKDTTWLPLNDVLLSIKSGADPGKLFKFNTADASNYYITIRNIVNGRVEIFPDKTNRINDEALRIINKKSNLEKNDVLFSSAGTVGKVAYVEEDPINWNVHSKVLLLKSNPEVLNFKYLYHYLQSHFFKELYRDITHFGIINNIRISELRRLEIPMTSLRAQNYIVEVLDTLLNTSNRYKEESSLRYKELEYYATKFLGIEGQYSEHFDNLRSRSFSLLGDVEFKTLASITCYKQSSKFCVKSTDYDDAYSTPVLTAGKTFILGYTDETDNICKASIDPCIIFDDFTTAVRYIDFDFKVKSSAVKMLYSADESKYLLKYIYYYLKYIPRYTIEHKRHWISRFSLQEIPIPSIEKQREVVNLLDKLEELSALCGQQSARYNKALTYARDQFFCDLTVETATAKTNAVAV